MAKNTADVAAAKAKKQKRILIVGGVLLLAVAAIQVPKLMKKDSPPESRSAASAASAGASGTSTGAVVVTGSSNSVTKPAGFVAGVALPGANVVRVAPSQLASFTLFEVKDPFVQQAGEETASGGTAADASTNANEQTSASTDASTAASGGTGADASAATGQPAPPPVVYATINLDGEPQQLKVKQKFPEADPLFVLRSLTKKQAKIGVAGGSFDDGQAVTLQYGKKVTLVNTATGVRYVLKLVYTGASPETIEGFTTAPADPAAASAAAGSSTATTTAAPS